MTGHLNRNRPPAFCPGCSHQQVVLALNKTLASLGLSGEEVAIVSDIGCSGLLDTFFNTHAFHGLHGRALTYAAGLKLARPMLEIVTVMGDGGLGIGGAHVLSACRRNLDLTLLVLNNFNYGMTGGQCSATTPATARTASAFLNQLERPLDICQVAAAAGAPYVARSMASWKDLDVHIERAVAYNGFSLLEIWGLCPGRFTRRNRMRIKELEAQMATMPPTDGRIASNERLEFGSHYRQCASMQQVEPPTTVSPLFSPPFKGRREVLLLGAAGQRIITAGEILCLASMSGGLHVTQKNDYPITVLRGHSVSEVVLSSDPIAFTGSHSPNIVIALAAEGVNRRLQTFKRLDDQALVIAASDITLPETRARVAKVDFSVADIPGNQQALAALAYMAGTRSVISMDMLHSALGYRYQGTVLKKARQVIDSWQQRGTS